MQSRWTVVVLVGSLFSAAAQRPNPVSQAEVRLEAKDGRTHFQLGDLITLELVFSNPGYVPTPEPQKLIPIQRAMHLLPGQQTVNSSDYGDLADAITISPADGWFQWQGESGHDYMSTTPLDATGVRVPLVLNQGYVFREPGHYEIAVTTRRMGPVPITTNAIGIDIEARPVADESALVKELDAAITKKETANTTSATCSCGDQNEDAERLAYLTGDDAARAKVKWLLGSDEDIATIMTNGLAATKNQALQLELLRAAWVNPEHAPDGTLQIALKRAEAFAQGQMEPAWRMVQAPKNDAATRALEAEYREDLDRVIAIMPQRAGDVRRDTAYYLMEDNQLSADELALVRPVVLEEFPRMEPIAQSMLIETKWNAIKDPSLAPYLEAMIESKANLIDAATAVQRLVEIDENVSRPYVIDMICRSERGLLLDKLNGVKEDRLPEVDECLTALLARGERREHDFDWEQAAQRAARFATPAILPEVKAAWTNASQDPSMLALLMRDAPKEAVALLAREPKIDWYPANRVYEALDGKFPPEVLAWLRDPSAPTSAVYELAQFGEPQDRMLLEQRLDDLRGRWLGHEAELKEAKVNTPAYSAKGEEQELVSSLLGAKAWKLTDEEKLRITEGCLSDWCQGYSPH
jgi:hypothetical protein